MEVDVNRATALLDPFGPFCAAIQEARHSQIASNPSTAISGGAFRTPKPNLPASLDHRKWSNPMFGKLDKLLTRDMNLPSLVLRQLLAPGFSATHTTAASHGKTQRPKGEASPAKSTAVGQKPNRTPSEHPNPTTKIGSKMGGECTYPKMGSHWF